MQRKGKKVSKKDVPPSTPAPRSRMTSSKLYFILGLSLMAIVLLLFNTIVNPSKPQDTATLTQKALSYIYHGDLAQLRRVIEGHPHVDWQLIQKQLKMRSFMHTALQGRHATIHSDIRLIGDHEDIIKYLLTEAKWSAKTDCILFYAIHYRNVMVIKSLLQHLRGNESLHCIVEQDMAGETAWHAVTKSVASGFARLYSKLFDANGIAQGPERRMAEILGLSEEAPQQNVPAQISMVAINRVTLDIDFSLLLRHYGDHVDLSRVVDTNGNTLLHTASYGGRHSIVRTLMEKGLSPYIKNNHGWSSIDYATIAGHHDIVNILTERDTVSHNLMLSDTVLHNARLKTLALSRYAKSGWSNVDIPAIEKYHIDSDIPVLDASKIDNFDKFFKEMQERRMPCIFTNTFNHWPAWTLWQKKELLRRYGGMNFMMSKIPYEDHYRANPVTINITMREFIDGFSNNTNRPMYVFDGNIMARHKVLYDNAPIPNFVDASAVYLKQFILGPRNSGAPPHFHGHAINGLVYGVKEWFFWRPANAYFSNQHIMDWKQQLDDTDPQFIRAVQYPGELVYVPDSWGHAVLNREDSIGVAYEFR